MRKTLIAFAVLLFAAPLFAQTQKTIARRGTTMDSFASDFHTIPVAGNVVGVAGARFQTRVTLLNPTSSTFPVQATLYDTTGTAHNAVLSLAPGEVKTFENFLGAVFDGYTGGGAVTLEAATTAGGTHNNRFIVDAESYTTGTGYGTVIPVLEFAGSSSRSFAPGVTVNSNARTNVGCFNQGTTTNTISATVHDSSGQTTVGTVTLVLPPNAWGQTAVTSVVSDGSVQFDPTDNAVCYAVIVQNATNDAHLVMASEYQP
ncbi:MAG TPA: hypothetical protein VGJ81_14170 [Thermoanaerobaculia bacterium]|jgi:hypothetical protein